MDKESAWKSYCDTHIDPDYYEFEREFEDENEKPVAEAKEYKDSCEIKEIEEFTPERVRDGSEAKRIVIVEG